MGYSSSVPGKKSSGTGMIVGGVLGILFAGLFIFAAIYNNKTTRELANSPEPPMPQGVPLDTPVLEQSVGTDSDVFLVRSNMNPNITISFDGRSSIKRLWNGKNASFEITAPFTQKIPSSTHTAEWGSLLTSSQPGAKDFTPWLSIKFPLDSAALHEWITAKASLDITYPASTAALGFTNKSEHLKRTLRFYVITGEEYKKLTAHDNWLEAKQNSGFWENEGVMICPVVLSLFLGILFLFLGISEKRG